MARRSESDAVHHPSHYQLPGEVIDLIQRELSPEEFRGYCKGNVLKYVTRAGLKNGAEDWAKAGKYMGWLLEACNESGPEPEE